MEPTDPKRRNLFAQTWREMLEATPNLDFWQDQVVGILVEQGRCVGVKTGLGLTIRSKAVVLTNGTFLNGLMHIGEKQFGGGRAGERAAMGITEQLVDLGFDSGRMKTGTPPRVDGRSLDYTKMTPQPGDDKPSGFSYLQKYPITKQLPCHITFTSEAVHDALREGFDRSPMFNGRIRGLGPLDIARALRTKLTASPTRTSTKCLSNQRVGRRVRFTSMASAQAFPRTCNSVPCA